jgi:hypothetical protein
MIEDLLLSQSLIIPVSMCVIVECPEARAAHLYD